MKTARSEAQNKRCGRVQDPAQILVTDLTSAGGRAADRLRSR